MALIDFMCLKCEEKFFEIINSDKDNVVCPKCGNTEVKRLYKGKFYGKNGSGCSGSCSGCAGCH